MKQRVVALILLVGLAALLVVLNALSYVQTQRELDSELRPNRSTFNPGSTGTQAFFTLLAETGRQPVRWRDSTEGLSAARNKPGVFIVIGTLRRPFSEGEAEGLFRWVAQGGRLVIIDRDPPAELHPTDLTWKLTVTPTELIDIYTVDASDQRQMTGSIDAAKPVQPTAYTVGVNAIQPSKFAGQISFERSKSGGSTDLPPDAVDSIAGPVVHVAGADRKILADITYGSGSIAYLSDPFIVSNGGIDLVDNSQLALNLVTGSGGPIAFDEYHQGYGTNANRMFQYFEGTPVIAIFVQALLLVGLIFVSQSRRFGRATANSVPDRLSKLEYVTAMAELERRTKAYDLAIENIYLEFRLRVARALGLDPMTTPRREIAQLAAERASMNMADIENVMIKCEAIVQGEPTGKAEVVELTSRIRNIEESLGIMRTSKGRSGK